MDIKLKAALAIIKKNKQCSFVTVGADGTLNARIMTNLFTEEARKGFFYFATALNSRKAEDIRKRKTAIIVFYGPANRGYVTVKGEAALVADKKTKDRFWQESWKAFWPDGRSSENYCIVKVRAVEAELLQGRRGEKEYFYFEQTVLP